MITQIQKALILQGLHQGPDAFLIGNAWDAGSPSFSGRWVSRRWPHPAAPPPACWDAVTG